MFSCSPRCFLQSGLRSARSIVALLTGILGLLLIGGTARGAEYSDRLVGISSRCWVGTGDNVMIAGFVINGESTKRVLVRASGPALKGFGLNEAMSNPKLTLFNGAGTAIATNDDWSGGNPTAVAAAAASVGAFAFEQGTKDAALVADVEPGVYTAHVSSADATQGVSLVEVYDISGSPRLLGISTRASVSTGSGILISGVAVASSAGNRRVLLRASGPALAGLGVSGALLNPVFAVYNAAGQQIAGNDDWEVGNDAATLKQTFTEMGLFAFAAGSKDAALIVDLPPGGYTVHVSGVGNGTGVTLVEAYDLTRDDKPPVAATATVQNTTPTSGASPAKVTVTRTGKTTLPLTVYYSMSGDAVQGTDYVALPGSVVIPAGASSAEVSIQALPVAGRTSGNRTATLTLQASANYSVGGTGVSANVGIFYESGSLFLANLRPSTGMASTAFGTAVIQMSPDGSYALVSVTFSNLSSPETVAYLRYSADGAMLYRLPIGQVDSAYWTLTGSGAISSADLVEGLRNGTIYISIESSSYPMGELSGRFLRATGSQEFTVPNAPPALPAGTPTDAEAVRFLTQATYGATPADVARVKAIGYSAWIDEQMAKTPSLHLDTAWADFGIDPSGGQGGYPATRPGWIHRNAAWWKIAIAGEDQLRQRVAFALSEIFVVSENFGDYFGWQPQLANYYDIFVRNAFGDSRKLLDEVTLSPMMGGYLSYLRNVRADPTKGTLPDENYAREVMQLFTIGLNELQPDGTLKLDVRGQPIPTYNQTTITEMARVFTGWSYYSTDASAFYAAPSDGYTPMRLYPEYHDDGAKTIVRGVVLPAGQGGVKDLKVTLDTLINHPNAGPFLCRQLIQKLVTSNPSPGYVYRVAQVYADNGHGVRGDLGAVVKAILLDHDARSVVVAQYPTFGKMKEPLMRFTQMIRGCDAITEDGRWAYSLAANFIPQRALGAPTVFNFFEPGYVQPGVLASAGLVAPEFQIHNGATAVSIANFLHTQLARNVYAGASGVRVLLTSFRPLAATPEQLVDRLALFLTADSMPAARRSEIVAGLRSLPAEIGEFERAQFAAYLICNSPSAAIQK